MPAVGEDFVDPSKPTSFSFLPPNAAGQPPRPAGAAFVQFCYMARASSIGGAREYNPGGSIHTDLDFTDQGMTYVIRFLKGWSPDTSVHGVRYTRVALMTMEKSPVTRGLP